MRKLFYSIALLAGAFAMASCSSDDNANNNNNPGIDTTYNKYADKSYGEAAIEAGTTLSTSLLSAYSAISADEQDATKKAELDAILAGIVDNTIIPTYTQLGDACDEMKAALGTLSTSEITQENIDNACTAFKKARKLWEKSEAFLGGAASDKEIDPHIDSWPLNRVDLHTQFSEYQTKGSFSTELDESVLGFHALEFIFFRNGANRTVKELNGMDTYKGFTDIKGSTELAYAETVLDDLCNYVYALQCSWEGKTDANATRYAKAAALNLNNGLTTSKLQTYKWNLLHYGDKNSTYETQADALEQILSMDEGSCRGICDEVSNKKIARPFNRADVSYVESPFSYNSISDFADNTRSIKNIWFGGLDYTAGKTTTCLYEYYKKYHAAAGSAVTTNIDNFILKIEAMPYPFVKYCETINGQKYEDSELKTLPEDEEE